MEEGKEEKNTGAPAEEKPAEEAKKEEKPAEEKPAEEAKPEEDSPSDSPLEKAEAVLEKLTEQNKRLEENLKKAEKISADTLLGGQTIITPEQSKEEKEIADAKQLLKGTGMEDYAFPPEKK